MRDQGGVREIHRETDAQERGESVHQRPRSFDIQLLPATVGCVDDNTVRGVMGM
jgi:hypothetical protein